ncbi:MAG: ester cyclase [Dehalococcoidia bacterium]
MANEAGIELVRRLWDEGWNGGNVAVVDDVVAEDAVAHGKTGRQAWKDAIAFYRGMFPDLHYAVDEIFGADSRVVVRWTATATDTVGLMGMPPTGKQASVTGINVYRVADGRLAEHWDEWDLAGLLQQLGVMPPLPAMP